MSPEASAKANRLMKEKSPYLLQHAHNPVDWYPWGDEAIQKAQKEDKPILVSIGYSTCHWCHVMEHESYEDPVVAALMNQYLVNIKVDREERPDIDKIYMTAVSAMSGQGGWPLNIFLTPDLKPIYGGTYFPPQAKWGQPAWRDVVQQVGDSWKKAEDRQKILEAASHITESLKQYVQMSSAPLAGKPEWLDRAFEGFRGSFDKMRGGFGPAPKFPMPVYHNFLLRYYQRTKKKEALDMSLETLRHMAKGGIYDHLGGGFARYSTDANWHVPHFEKMLYDNAQLATVYVDAYNISHDEEFKRVAQETFAYIQRDMTHEQGGFFSAEDADSPPHPALSPGRGERGEGKKEGAFYVWERSEIIGVAGDKAGEIFCYYYGVGEKGNVVQDPHQEFTNKNVLYVEHGLAETAKKFAMPEKDAALELEAAKKKLVEARSRLPRPLLDDKIISAWNGLMISAFARGYQVFGEKSYLISAQRAAQFVKKNLYDASHKELYRRWREGDRQARGIADDYAFVIQGIIDLYESDFDVEWLNWASELMDVMKDRFYDAPKGGFFMTAANQDPHLLLRVKEDSDNVEPSASSVAATNLLRLAQFTGRKDYEELADTTLKAFGTHMQDAGRGVPQMLVALDFALTEPRQIVIAGNPGAADTEAMLRVLHQHFIPVKSAMLLDGGARQKYLSQKLEFLQTMHPLDGKATAYVCVRHTCKQPTSDLAKFEILLKAL